MFDKTKNARKKINRFQNYLDLVFITMTKNLNPILIKRF